MEKEITNYRLSMHFEYEKLIKKAYERYRQDDLVHLGELYFIIETEGKLNYKYDKTLFEYAYLLGQVRTYIECAICHVIEKRKGYLTPEQTSELKRLAYSKVNNKQELSTLINEVNDAFSRICL